MCAIGDFYIPRNRRINMSSPVDLFFTEEVDLSWHYREACSIQEEIATI